MPVPTPNRLLAIDELGQMDVAEWNQDIGEVRAVSEDRRKAIVDLHQDREVLQARIRELERFIGTGDQKPGPGPGDALQPQRPELNKLFR